MKSEKILIVAALSGLIFFPAALRAADAAPTRSIHTGITLKNCPETPDMSDPNNTPKQICPGPGGYKLKIANAEGRAYVTIVAPDHREFDLPLEEIRPDMYHLSDQAQWRVSQKIPHALILNLHIHGDDEDPAKVSAILPVVAKITAAEACVTDVFEKPAPEKKILAAADQAPAKKCWEKGGQ